jgi:O-acetyl-ADP-ribose deacetylase (regulator of RNase III)
MRDLKIITGNILDATEEIIGQQCNCVTSDKAKGLAGAIFARFPYADVYARRGDKRGVPGTWSLHGNGEDERYIVNFFTQYYPGVAKYTSDSEELRARWFRSALVTFLAGNHPSKLALPHGIGCGLAGGCWPVYEGILKEVSHQYGVEIVLYQLPARPAA